MRTTNLYPVLGVRRRSDVLVDAVLAAGTFAATVLVLAHGGTGSGARAVDAAAVLLAACASLPLLAWRRAPLAAFATMLAASAALMARGYPGQPPIGATIALYLIAASRDEAHPWTRATTVVVAALFAVHFAAFGLGHGTFPTTQLAVGALVWALAWFAGDRTRLRRQQLSELEQRALRAERDAERDRRLAVAEERARIARDLHDSAAHAINVIAVQAGAARLLQERDPGRARRALQTIEDVARETVADIDHIVHSLREGGSGRAGVEPPAGLAALEALVSQHAAAGRQVTVARQGEPPPLGSALDQAAYRILQESLTNSARHGAGDTRVELAFGPTALELTVTNAIAAGTSGHAGGGNGGHGLVGMRERATLLGGALRAEPVDGSFRVHAQLPYGGGG